MVGLGIPAAFHTNYYNHISKTCSQLRIMSHWNRMWLFMGGKADIYSHEMDVFFSSQLHNITTKVKYITIIVYLCLLLFDYYNWSWLLIQIFRYHTNEFTFPTSDPIFDIKKDLSFQYCITSMIIKLDPSSFYTSCYWKEETLLL